MSLTYACGAPNRAGLRPVRLWVFFSARPGGCSGLAEAGAPRVDDKGWGEHCVSWESDI